MKVAEHSNIHTHCLICHSESLFELSGYRSTGLVKCMSCHFVFSRFIPTTQDLVSHYETYPRTDKISPITIKRYQELARSLERYSPGRTWLDVGCGNGHLLHTVQQLGWRVLGTEFTNTAVDICIQKGIEMHLGPLDVNHYPSESIDVISFIEVLEHINDPHTEIEKFFKLLRKGGVVYITTPNFNSHARYLLREKWSIIEYPEHLCYYSPNTLHRLLVEHGFIKISLSTSGINPSRLFRKLPADMPEQKSIVRIQSTDVENVRNFTESNLIGRFIKRSINGLLSMTNLGDTIKALYIKN